MEIIQEDLQCSQVWSVRKALEGREFASDIHSITIDGKVGALIERDTDVVPGRYKLGYDREGAPTTDYIRKTARAWIGASPPPPHRCLASFYDFAT